jgi:hypothetical protein
MLKDLRHLYETFKVPVTEPKLRVLANEMQKVSSKSGDQKR